MQIKQTEDARREQNTRKQSQKVQKETYKFVKEVEGLNEKNAELEEQLAKIREEYDLYATYLLYHCFTSAQAQILTQKLEPQAHEGAPGAEGGPRGD